MIEVNFSLEGAIFSNAAYINHAEGKQKISLVDLKDGSAFFDGSGDFLSVPGHPDFAFGDVATATFVLEAFVRLRSAGAGRWRPIISTAGAYVAGVNDTWSFRLRDDEVFQFMVWDDKVARFALTVFGVYWQANRWYHLAFVMDNGTAYMFIDGISQTYNVSGTVSGTLTEDGLNNGIYIGATPAAVFYHNGWIDEIRISKGVARGAPDFSPPSEPYISDTYTKLLLHCDGTDGSTHFPDDGDTGHTVTTHGNAQVDAAYHKFNKYSSAGETATLQQIDLGATYTINEVDFLIPCNTRGETGIVQARRKLNKGAWGDWVDLVLISDYERAFATSGSFTARYIDLDLKLNSDGMQPCAVGRPRIRNWTPFSPRSRSRFRSPIGTIKIAG